MTFFRVHIRALLNSYSQVFFTVHPIFGVMLVLASFLDPLTGLCGLVSVIVALITGRFLRLSNALLENGAIGFNALFAGMAVGAMLPPSPGMPLYLFGAGVLTTVLAGAFLGISNRTGLPYLSLPFIFTTWLLLNNNLRTLAVPINNGEWQQWVLMTDAWFNVHTPSSLQNLMMALSAVFFQHHWITGLLVAIGLLIASRIAFLSVLVGYAGMWLTAKIWSDPSMDIMLSFNHIFTSLALGAFFVIPSWRSLLLIVFLSPVTLLIGTGLSHVLMFAGLPVFSLPFSITVLMMIGALRSAGCSSSIRLVAIQEFSPEKNLYSHQHYYQVRKNAGFVSMQLPFFGEWTVSQGYHGKLTHKGEYESALDFVVTDEHQKTFRLPGSALGDFYSYGLPVVAPADGQVVTVEDGIEDNAVGEQNLQQNWGNTIVIRHTEQVYSKISHLRKSSVKVKPGDIVKRGDQLAQCGNSGRSPEPHIHFQVQQTPAVDAATISYPLTSYLVRNGSLYFRGCDVPKEGERVSQVMPSAALKTAFQLGTGKQFTFKVKVDKHESTVKWACYADAYNNSYIEDGDKNRAYYENDGTALTFTGFSGSDNSLLYGFYLGAFHVPLASLHGVSVTTPLPIKEIHGGWKRFLQDFAAPFYIYLQPQVTTTVERDGETGGDNHIVRSDIRFSNSNTINKQIEIQIRNKKIASINIKSPRHCIVAENISC